MIERVGNIFQFIALHPSDGVDAICITTNGYVKQNGRAVMGRGVAWQATQKFPGIDRILGTAIRRDGNHVHQLEPRGLSPAVVSFPVKHYWDQPARLPLIEQSAYELLDLTEREEWKRVVLPRPGCGNGCLSWASVKPILVPILDDRFLVYELPERV